MIAVKAIVAEISEPLTRPEICTRYPNEWVVIAEMDYVHPDGFEFRTARVVGYGPTPSEAFTRARPWRDRYEAIGHYYTGKIQPPFPHLPRIVMTDEIRNLVRDRR